jgi:L-alanine-DL-glutamate epimerase-like enolase superfamily enzyme
VQGLTGGELRIEEVHVRPLSVPLLEPFVIASGRVDATRAAEIRVRVAWRGRDAVGLGEAACLPPVTREDQDDVVREVTRLAPALVATPLVATAGALEDAMRAAFPDAPVARAGVETAVLDALARCAGVPLRTLLGGRRGAATNAIETDVTVAIAEPEVMARLAREWCARGFRSLKIKVGKDVDADARALAAIAAAAPEARLRVDANAGYSARDAIALGRACAGLRVECWEQPCAADDLDGLREVAAALDAPVIADESMHDVAGLRALIGRVGGVNLKLAKHGGPLHALRLGLEAQAAGLRLMMGGMVETRLGMTAAAHVACALGGADYVDLDTAWLLADDPYAGGYVSDGPRYRLPAAPGLDVRRR